jgi:hypothetical protein
MAMKKNLEEKNPELADAAWKKYGPDDWVVRCPHIEGFYEDDETHEFWDLEFAEPPDATGMIAQVCDLCDAQPEDLIVLWCKRHVVLAEKDGLPELRSKFRLKELTDAYPDFDVFRLIFYETQNRERGYNISPWALTKFFADNAHVDMEFAGAIMIPKGASTPEEWRTAVPNGPHRQAHRRLVEKIAEEMVEEMRQRAHPN